MYNILLISTIYPLPNGNKGTGVCHFFTREWVKMGYNVRVVHFQAVYPLPLYWIARFNQKRIAAKTGAVVYTRRDSEVKKYLMDDVPIMRVPLYKPIPHGKFSAKAIKRSVAYINDIYNQEGFVPDVIIGHFPNPQIEVVGMLKDIYPTAKTCIVMHGDIEIMKKVYNNQLSAMMRKIDAWGFRCPAVLHQFERAVGRVENPFYCYSGIPENFITPQNIHTFEKTLSRFLYVGEMIERKYPSVIIDALVKVYPQKDFNLNYVGDGQQLEAIKKKKCEYGLDEEVKILGRIPREDIIKQYDQTECMVMISRGEAYGLVYLEAMARGCITIASRNEGFDGVIVDGVNGFLCKAGDADELSIIIQRINSMTSEERQAISERAIDTAKSLTDYLAAKRYIDDVIERL